MKTRVLIVWLLLCVGSVILWASQSEACMSCPPDSACTGPSNYTYCAQTPGLCQFAALHQADAWLCYTDPQGTKTCNYYGSQYKCFKVVACVWNAGSSTCSATAVEINAIWGTPVSCQ